MREVLVASVVHDLKNALGSLTNGAAEVCARASGTALEADTLNLHAGMALLSQRLIAFLTLYRSERVGMAAQLRDNNPEDFLREVASGLVLPPAAPALKTLAAEDIPAFWYFDDYLVRLALEAALSNALRFGRREIVLAAGLRNGYLVFSAADDGPGLDAAAERSPGLGTALCQEIAKAHLNGKRCGKVVLKNREGGGAMFELWLP